jgi:predicted  nucleic acid-binding Zn-ribbon protein
VKAAQEEVNKQKALLKACDKDIGAKVSEQKTLQKEHHNSEIKIKELDNKIVKFQKDTKDASKLVTFSCDLIFIIYEIKIKFYYNSIH